MNCTIKTESRGRGPLLAALTATALAGCRSPATDESPAFPAPSTTDARLYDGFDNYRHPVATASAEAQAYVDQGMQWLFGFNHDEAIRSFHRAAAIDPELALPWWGIAFANGINVNKPAMSAQQAEDAFAATREALARRDRATAVERALIDAIAERYVRPRPADSKPLEQAYADAMQQAWRDHPDDADVGALYAESLMDLQPWDYWTREGEPKGRILEITAVLERVMAIAPDHPGALHLYIHAVEASQHPERAEAAADRLARLVPGSSHLSHMPSHIYGRVGRYADAADANARAVAADRRYLPHAPEQDYYGLYISHNLHFLAYAAMMEGRFDTALQAAREMETEVPETFMARYPQIADGWASALPHVLVRFGKWQQILALPDYPEDRPISRAMRRYARSIANSALGRTEAATAEIAAFEAEAARVPTGWAIGFNPAHAVFPLARKMMHGELAFRLGEHDRAFALLREGAELEDELLYNEPPSWLQPTRHALGALLMAAGRYAEAEVAYLADLEHNPKNGWSLLGLENARRALGRTETVDALAAQRAAAWSRADVRPTSSCYCETGAAALLGR
ncbi:MAG: hypothetical protein KDE27_23390 [Planctomycetes bacterium]|nr:hypothetical protein [Planctomycetota bacterium]